MNWKGWLLRGILVLLAGFIVSYIGDWAIFLFRGSPLSKVTVNQFQSVPLKGTKIEYDYLGSSDVPCSQSLLGLLPFAVWRAVAASTQDSGISCFPCHWPFWR